MWLDFRAFILVQRNKVNYEDGTEKADGLSTRHSS